MGNLIEVFNRAILNYEFPDNDKDRTKRFMEYLEDYQLREFNKKMMDKTPHPFLKHFGVGKGAE